MAIVIGLAVVGGIGLFVAGFFSNPGLGTANLGNANVEGCTAACANLVAKRHKHAPIAPLGPQLGAS